MAEEKKSTNENTGSQKGGITVDIEHLFPIIKKWLYSEKEIFLREIVSNACDAVTKLKRLESLGEIHDIGDDFRIDVTVDPDEKTLTVSDNGIGMTEEEVRRYICQIALSGAVDFIAKYEGENADADGIIGHFGLGFYSAFMVSDRVELVTKSYTGAPAVRWVCNGDGEFELQAGEKESRGTQVIMHITDEEAEYLKGFKIREMLSKYCAFMPYDIYFEDLGAVADAADKPKTDDEAEKAPEEPKPVNDTHPLWQKTPSECTEEEYKAFYQKVFSDYKEPLFYIHINADYPLNFKGILYFPRLNQHMDNMDGQIKLYYNQVFVADNIKELLPEYLTMLRGVLDCPELPLNVSRSYLQNSAYAAKIAQHISKKVADKLNGMFTNEREKFEGLWPDLKTFLEYAALREKKFYDRIKDAVLLRTTNTEERKNVTVAEYLEHAEATNKDIIYYTTDPQGQSQYIAMFQAQGIEIAVLDTILDTQFINLIEQDRSGVKFVRIDADVAGALKEEGEVTESEALTELFRTVSGDKDLSVTFARLKDDQIPAMVNIDEEAHRMEEMMRMYQLQNGMDMMKMPEKVSLVLNTNNALITRLTNDPASDSARRIAGHVYHLALLSQRQLTPEEMTTFLRESYAILDDLK